MPSLRRVTGLAFMSMGTLHFLRPEPFEAIVPPEVPMSPHAAVLISGVAEIAGGAALLTPRLDRLSRPWMLALLAAVFPANVHWAVRPESVGGVPRVPRWALWARLPLQAVFALAVWRVTSGRQSGD